MGVCSGRMKDQRGEDAVWRECGKDVVSSGECVVCGESLSSK